MRHAITNLCRWLILGYVYATGYAITLHALALLAAALWDWGRNG